MKGAKNTVFGLTYLGRALEDPDGRQLTYELRFDGTFLYASYKMPDQKMPPVFRVYTIKKQD